jgi:hypothetical protein
MKRKVFPLSIIERVAAFAINRLSQHLEHDEVGRVTFGIYEILNTHSCLFSPACHK